MNAGLSECNVDIHTQKTILEVVICQDNESISIAINTG